MIHKLAFFAFLVGFALSTTAPARAQWVSTNGPPGNINALAAVGNTLFAGSSAGIFFLNEGDSSWTATSMTDNVQALLLSGSNLLAGTTSGVFFANGLDTGWIQSNDSNYDFAFASLGSDLFVGTDNGIFISINDGYTWTPTNYQYDAYALAAIGNDLFAGDYEGGVSVSPDNGRTWTMVDNGLPGNDVDAFAVNGNDLFAGTKLISGGVYLTTNNGAIWTPVNKGLPDTSIIRALWISEPYLFAGTDSDVFLSSNNGASWRNVSGAMNDTIYASSVRAYSFAVIGNNLFAGTQRGVWMCQLPFFAAVGTTAPTEASLTNYPNPFSDKTTIEFSSAESGVAEIYVVNLLGSKVARLFDGELDAGEHSFEWDASGMAPGMYECVAQINGQVQRVPLVLMR